MTITEQQVPPLPEGPYKGIESFRYIDQKIFSAREEETWDLLSNILIYRGVLLYGGSGSGKSSIINAALIPAALKENLIANRLRVQPRLGKEFKVERISTRSEDKPPFLPSIFVEAGSSKDKTLSCEISLSEFDECIDRLRDEPAGATRVLLIFDQFEEFITLFEEAMHGGESAEAKLAKKEAPKIQKAVLAKLTELMEDVTLPVKFLFVFREDYLARLNILFRACPELLDQYVRLLPPRVEVAGKIIRSPFNDEELRAKFIGDQSGQSGREIPEQLAEDIATQFQVRSESGFINLSELQIVCRMHWESRDPVKFFKEKGKDIQKVLEDYWAGVLVELGNLYDPAIALLGHMVTSSNTRNIVSEPDLILFEKVNFSPGHINAALDALVERKLVRREPRHQIYFYEIASEFLVPWIQLKKTVRLARIEAIKLAAERRRRSFWIGTCFVTLFVLVASFLSYKTYRLNKTRGELESKLDQAKVDTVKVVGLLDNLSYPDPQIRVDAVNELITLHKANKISPELVEVIVSVVKTDEDERVTKAATYFMNVSAQQAETRLTKSVKLVLDFTDEHGKALPLDGLDLLYVSLDSPKSVPEKYQVRGLISKTNTISAPAGDYILSVEVKGYKFYSEGKVSLPDGVVNHTVRLQPRELAEGTNQVTDYVTLVLKFDDEQGNAISPNSLVNLTISLDSPKSVPEKDRVTGRISRSSSITAPAGDYILHVQARGYEDYRDGKLTLRDQVQAETITLRKLQEKPILRKQLPHITN